MVTNKEGISWQLMIGVGELALTPSQQPSAQLAATYTGHARPPSQVTVYLFINC